MKVLCFGSEILEGDKTAFEVCEILKGELQGVEFVRCEDPFEILKQKGEVLVLDVVKGLKKVEFVPVIALKRKKMYTLHDLDLGFLLRLADSMQGEGPKIRVLGIPQGSKAEEVAEEVKRLLSSL
ncbi:MAG: hypothetical protein J7J17_04075 [Hadesarchaea archaeon]|nr:hypothetical protein [Hadesarchaea archaeon]